MPDKRRKSREELTEELPSATPEEAEKSADERARTESERGGDDSRGAPEGDFIAVSDQDQQEINDLFRLIHSEGYLTAGTYEAKSDGENVLVSLQVLLPSSGGLPGEGEGGE